MNIYITHEISDYGLSDLSNTKAFISREFAKEYCDKCYEDYGWHLDIMEIKFEN
jgi:hypothetical protein